MRQKLPAYLVYTRLILGVAALGICWLPPTPARRYQVAGLVVLGLLTDVFDGVLARRWGVATAALRRLDSSIDQLFWLCVLAGLVCWHPAFFRAHAGAVGAVLGLEALAYGVSYGRFRREIALHTLLAKGWTLVLAAFFAQLLLTGTAHGLFRACVGLGIISRLEILAILLTLRTWATDVPSWFQAVQLRRGQPIRRNQLFN